MDSPPFLFLGHFLSSVSRERCCRFIALSFCFLSIGIFNCWWFSSIPGQDLDRLSALDKQNISFSVAIDDYLIDEAIRSYALAQDKFCDLTRGQWSHDSSPPLYTNDTCKYIQDNQNCMSYGRPDRGFLYWKWKPFDCELPSFYPKLFLAMMRGKKLVFIGDSIARNQMQSLLCALAQVEDPINLYYDGKEKEYKWGFPSYNFTLANSWSPFLVNYTFENEIYNIHLDMPDVGWSSPFANYDVAIISTGYWYFRPSLYHMNNSIIGANARSGLNLTRFDMLPAMKIALETVLRHMTNEFDGVTILRTITVPHFENGSWSTGGGCHKTQPDFDPEMKMPLPWMSNAMYTIQMEEYKKAIVGKQGAIMQRLKLLNVTYSALLRPDGHPGSFRLQKPNEPVNDCLHWCLPGPIDMWNQLLMEILKSYFLSPDRL